MKPTIIILLILTSIFSVTTEQTPDLLIYNSEIIKIKEFPLEPLVENDSRLKDKLTKDVTCIDSGCWRQYVGTWKIEKDSLFLVGLKDCCNDKEIKLARVFDKNYIKEDKVFAFWYTNSIYAGFGKILENPENVFVTKYEKRIRIKISKGVITELKVDLN